MDYSLCNTIPSGLSDAFEKGNGVVVCLSLCLPREFIFLGGWKSQIQLFPVLPISF